VPISRGPFPKTKASDRTERFRYRNGLPQRWNSLLTKVCINQYTYIIINSLLARRERITDTTFVLAKKALGTSLELQRKPSVLKKLL
jgi:hypothetical protein